MHRQNKHRNVTRIALQEFTGGLSRFYLHELYSFLDGQKERATLPRPGSTIPGALPSESNVIDPGQNYSRNITFMDNIVKYVLGVKHKIEIDFPNTPKASRPIKK